MLETVPGGAVSPLEAWRREILEPVPVATVMWEKPWGSRQRVSKCLATITSRDSRVWNGASASESWPLAMAFS